MRLGLVVLIGGCVGTSASPPTVAAPTTQVDGDGGINTLTKEACWSPCLDPMPMYANAVRRQAGDTVFLEVEPLLCKVPGFSMIPMECVATCDARGMHTLTVDFGPVGETTQNGICRALELERGAPLQGTCAEYCTENTGCSWEPNAERPAVKLMGHVEVTCADAGG